MVYLGKKSDKVVIDCSRLSSEYRRYLLGTPIAALDLTEQQKDLLLQFIHNSAPQRSILEISTLTGQKVSTSVCYILKMTEKTVRKDIKSVTHKETISGKKKLLRDPALANYVKKQSQSTLTLPEVYCLRYVNHEKMQEIVCSGGSPALFFKAFHVHKCIARGLSAAEISEKCKINIKDIYKVMQLEKK